MRKLCQIFEWISISRLQRSRRISKKIWQTVNSNVSFLIWILRNKSKSQNLVLLFTNSMEDTYFKRFDGFRMSKPSKTRTKIHTAALWWRNTIHIYKNFFFFQGWFDWHFQVFNGIHFSFFEASMEIFSRIHSFENDLTRCLKKT